MGQYGIDAVTALHDQLDALYAGAKSDADLWAMVGSTPMIGQHDVQSEFFHAADAEETLAFAEDMGLGMLGMWSVNRDRPCDADVEWARSDCNGRSDIAAWTYAPIFAAYGE